ncbi:hypothetical protein SASPL_146934 [Salvia splendens]|uniref:DUF7769 domain-containing protein n=1 Tax=Salvia splendens TaxID=180675 RepID=A0A8X8WDJ7_SALSN|nr:hypothetical protein SASPL_146934 [Salvia splendens]
MRPREYSLEQRNQVVQFILERCIKGKPPRGTLKEAQLKFSISRQTCTRYWNAAKKQRESGKAIQLVSGKKSRQYSKVIHFDLTLFQGLNFSKRCNIRSIAIGLGCSKSTVWRWVKAGLIRTHTSAIRPDLTAPNKLLRLRFFHGLLAFWGCKEGFEAAAGLPCKELPPAETEGCILACFRADWDVELPAKRVAVISFAAKTEAGWDVDKRLDFLVFFFEAGAVLTLKRAVGVGVWAVGGFGLKEEKKKWGLCWAEWRGLSGPKLKEEEKAQKEDKPGPAREERSPEAEAQFDDPARRVAQLPHNLEVPKELAIECISYLKDHGCIDGLEMIARALGIEV